MVVLPDVGSVYRLIGAEGSALASHHGERFVLMAPGAAGHGRSLKLDVTDRITGGRLLLTMEGASTITLDIEDPDWEVEHSGILDVDGDLRMGKIDMQLDGVWFRLAQATRQDPAVLRLVFEDLTISMMREHHKPMKAARGSVTRAEFIGKMVNELPAPMRLFYSPERSEKQPVARPDYPTATPSKDDKTGGFDKGAHFNAYHKPATKDEMGEAATVLTVCDQLSVSTLVRESIICAALGESGFAPTRVSSAGAKGVFQMMPEWWSKIGWQDTEKQARHFIEAGFYRYGGARKLASANPQMSPGEIASRVEGSATDGQNAGYYNDFLPEARKIIRLWKGGGGSSSGDTVFQLQAYQFTRGLPGRKEDSWEAGTRLAGQVNWRLFVAGGVVVYASDDWLIAQSSRLTIPTPTEDFLVDRPTYDWDHGKLAGNVVLQVVASRWSQLPSTIVHLSEAGWGPIRGRWLLLEVDQNLFVDDDCRITLTKPIQPRKEIAAQVQTVSGDTPGRQGSGTGSIFYVGDSLGVGTMPFLRRIVRGTRIDSEVLGSQRSSWGVDQLEGALRLRTYDNIVFDFGTNDTKASQLRASIKRARRIAPEAHIYVMTLNGPFDTAAKNKLLNDWADPHVHVVPWRSYARDHGVQFESTGVHPDADGYEKRAHLIAKVMGFE
jgi:hypothetical protein